MTFKKDVLIGAAIFALGIAYLALSYHIHVPSGRQLGLVNARFMPYILGAITCVLGVAQMIVGWTQPAPPDREASPRTDFRTLILTAALMVLYVALLEWLGFVICSVLYLICQFSVLTPPGRKIRLPLYALIAIISSVATYLVFRYAFDMLLPVSPLGYF